MQVYDVYNNRCVATNDDVGRVKVPMGESVYYMCKANSKLNKQPVTIKKYFLPQKQGTK